MGGLWIKYVGTEIDKCAGLKSQWKWTAKLLKPWPRCCSATDTRALQSSKPGSTSRPGLRIRDSYYAGHDDAGSQFSSAGDRSKRSAFDGRERRGKWRCGQDHGADGQPR